MHDPAQMPARIETFLKARGEPDDLRVTEYSAITGGFSLLMARCTVVDSSGTRRYVLRGNPPAGASLTSTDRHQEWQLLEALTKFDGVPMPGARYFDGDGGELGTVAIVLDHVDGPNLVTALHAAGEKEIGDLADRYCDAIAAVHAVDLDALAVELPRPSSWDAYLDDKIDLWRRTEAAHAERNPFLRYVAAWLDRHRPPPAPLGLVHGEFQTGNVVVGPDGALQIVDWEYAHIGDPRADLGWSQAVGGISPPDLIGADPVRFCQRYCDATGLSPEIVNPLTLAYFAVASSAAPFSALLAGHAAMARGENAHMASAYTISAQSFAHRQWFEGSRQLEQAMAAIAQQMEEASR
jgi:aminoglycoside phosphotransferase (APT) family kinase protein